MEDDFLDQENWYRFCKVSNIVAVYSELLNYEPFKYVLEAIKKKLPSMESDICGPLFRFVRNILAHFPVFECWDDVWVNKDLVNWQRVCRS